MTSRLRVAALTVCAATLLGAAPAGAADFLYVAQRNGTDVSQYRLDAAGTPTSGASVTAGGSPWQIAVSPDHKSLYAALYNDNAVAQFTIDQTTGALAAKSPATVATGGLGTAGLAMSPDGASLYASNRGGSTISQFDVDAQGRLTLKPTPSIGTGGLPERMVITPDGRSLYATSRVSTNPGRVYQFSIGAGGQLAAKSPSNVSGGRAPEGLALNAAGTMLYVSYTHPGSGGPITMWDVDPSTGALSAHTPASVAADANTGGLAFSPDFSRLFLSECNTDCSVFTFNADPTGALSLASRSAAGTLPGYPLDTLVSPNGNAVYTSADAGSGNGKVMLFDVAGNGALTPKATPSLNFTGTIPYGLKVVRLPDATPPTAPAQTIAAPKQPTICVSRRNFRIHWIVEPGQHVTSLAATVDGKRRVLKSSARSTLVDLRGHGADTVTVAIAARVTRAGGKARRPATIRTNRSYHTCARADTSSHLATLRLR